MKKGNFTDKPLTCVDCGREFLFTAGERAFYFSKRLSEPKRCPECRRLRRERLVPEEAVRDER